MNNIKSLKEIVKQLRSCGYICEAGPLENNVDFQMLERIVGVEPERTLDDVVSDISKAFRSFGKAVDEIGFLTVRSPQEIRDDIIGQAKRDVADLLVDVSAFVTTGGHFEGYKALCEPEFIVNREKRTVVVLMRGFRSKSVRARGIAKCAPDDCFNVRIGKAIALRRALGLEVPAEYLSAPQPTEVRIGDVVKTFEHSGAHHSTFKVENVRFEVDEIRLEKRKNGAFYTEFLPDLGDCIIDDSREEVGE